MPHVSNEKETQNQNYNKKAHVQNKFVLLVFY